jgi:hypothetical protein
MTPIRFEARLLLAASRRTGSRRVGKISPEFLVPFAHGLRMER